MSELDVPRLPDRYEDLNDTYRSHLRPVPELNELVLASHKSMRISGGIRFLPVFGLSGAGKTSAVSQLETHIPGCRVVNLEKRDLEDREVLREQLVHNTGPFAGAAPDLTIAVIDEYEEKGASEEDLPSRFVEMLSHLDRDKHLSQAILVVWLTTSPDFQQELVAATSRNSRILAADSFELLGPSKIDWPSIIKDTFSFHNDDTPLADFDIVESDLEDYTDAEETIGDAIGRVAVRLGEGFELLSDISRMRVVILWPVSTLSRLLTVQSFSHETKGYALNWDRWVSQLTADARADLPLHGYNQARLYFDIRVVPFWAADLQMMCRDLDNASYEPTPTSIERFQATHLFKTINNEWERVGFKNMLERPKSKRQEDAETWYESTKLSPATVHRRVALYLTKAGIPSKHEQPLTKGGTPIQPDVLADDGSIAVELKIFSAAGTTPAAIRDQLTGTLKKFAVYAGFLPRT